MFKFSEFLSESYNFSIPHNKAKLRPTLNCMQDGDDIFWGRIEQANMGNAPYTSFKKFTFASWKQSNSKYYFLYHSNDNSIKEFTICYVNPKYFECSNSGVKSYNGSMHLISTSVDDIIKFFEMNNIQLPENLKIYIETTNEQ